MLHKLARFEMLLSLLLPCRLGSGQVKGPYYGNDCEFIRLARIHTNPGCDLGDEFILKRRPPIRKQFMILNNETVLVFVKNGKKFPQCTEYTDVTSKVRNL